jgi:hypothetical protein
MGQEEAAATLRIALGPLLVLNAIALGLLVADLRPALARLYTRGQLWRLGLLTFGGGTLLPLGLVFVGNAPPLMLAAGTFILLASLAIRFLIIKIPHASPSVREEIQAAG